LIPIRPDADAALRQDLGLQGRVAIITGAAHGIGQAAVDLFLAQGVKVVAFDVDGAALDALAAGRDGAALAIHVGDVSVAADWTAAADLAEARFGGLDLLFNNAGVAGPFSSILTYPEDAFDRVLAVNVRGVFLGIQICGGRMRKRGKGAIVNTSSIVGFTGGRSIHAYTASKHAVLGLTKSAAVELATHGIRVNAVCPSPTATEMMFDLERRLAPDDPLSVRANFTQGSPMNRYGEPLEVAAAAAWLMSDAASYVSGAALPVDGAMLAR
jgi:NAD(P)-dependent dehydrogenase (short-subunit alcohol dehydrogenase family)